MSASLCSPATAVGVPALVVPPLPSWPRPLSPQHCAPSLTTAQAWLSPAESLVTPLNPDTRTGRVEDVNAPPSSPSMPKPQH